MVKLDRAASRLVKAVAVILAIACMNFVLIRMAPGDPVAVMAGEAAMTDQAYLDELRERFGLDRPVHEQLLVYLSNVATLDFGTSYRQGRPVADIILERLPATLVLTITAFVISLALGITAGVIAARRPGGWVDTVVSTLALAFYATPLFWVGLMAILLFSLELGWLPAFGMHGATPPAGGFAYLAEVAKHLVLPAMTLGLFYTGVYARLTRAQMLEVQSQDFVRTARAKGLTEPRVERAHVLRNALLPVVTMAGVQAGHLVGGTILVETVFAWPGIGRLAFNALLQRDYSVLLGVFLVTSTMVVVINLLTDLVYGLIDPRIRFER